MFWIKQGGIFVWGGETGDGGGVTGGGGGGDGGGHGISRAMEEIIESGVN